MYNETETKILEAVFRTVDRYAIEGTRMHLIAQESNLSQSSLHYHFHTKRELLIALLDYMQMEFSRSRGDALAKCDKTLECQLEAFFEQKKKYTQDNPKYDRVQFDYWSQGQIDADINASINRSFQIWRDDIRETIISFKPDIADDFAESIAIVMVSMMMGASFQYLSDKKCMDLDAHYRFCLNIILKCLLPESPG